MRLFLSLSVPEIHLKDKRFTNLRTNLSSKKIDHRFLVNDLFIPIAELGDHGMGGFYGMYTLLRSALVHFTPFTLKLNGLWAHPYYQEADMLWVDVQNSKVLNALQNTVAETLNLKQEQLIRPHIPLVYLKHKRNVGDMISPFKNMDLGKVEILQIKILEKIAGNAGVRMIGSITLNHHTDDSAHL